MKTQYLLCCCILFTSLICSAQYDPTKDTNKKVEEEPAKPPLYLNLSGGIDNHIGIVGVGFLVPAANLLAIRGGVGIGVWGAKYNLGLKIQNCTKNGWGGGIGYSYCPGIEEIEITFSSQTSTHVVPMELKPTGSFNLTFNYNWMIGEKSILYLESGYAINNPNYHPYRVKNGDILSQDEETIMEILRPGGIILALGIQVGLQ